MHKFNPHPKAIPTFCLDCGEYRNNLSHYPSINIPYQYPQVTFDFEFHPPKEVKMSKKKLNVYYVGATHISASISRGCNDAWTSASLEDAIQKAKEKLEQNPHQECAHIVKIIKVVRRSKPPIVVEDFKG